MALKGRGWVVPHVLARPGTIRHSVLPRHFDEVNTIIELLSPVPPSICHSVILVYLMHLERANR